MFRYVKAAAIALVALASPAAAEFELSFYLGTQSVDDSRASGTLPGGVAFSRNMNWKAKSFDSPIYYGGRAIWWMDNNIGFGIDGTHTKAYASAGDLAALGLGRLELSDGHNIFTANVMKRWPDALPKLGITPYIGGGIGVAIPHVDAQVLGAPNRTFGYEYTGPAVRGIAGIKYNLNDRWALFSEYQITWSDNEVTLDPSILVPGQVPGQLNTEITTHALNFGISYSF